MEGQIQLIRQLLASPPLLPSPGGILCRIAVCVLTIDLVASPLQALAFMQMWSPVYFTWEPLCDIWRSLIIMIDK